MITVTTTYTKPDLPGINFYLEEHPELFDKLMTLIGSSQYAPIEHDFMVDDWTNVSVAQYNTREQLENFLAEIETEIPHFFATRDAYCAQTGIRVEREEKET